MRFKQFLEATVKPHEHEPKAGDELIKILRENCGKALESAGAGNFIYRGTRTSFTAGVYNPSSGERKSQNTSNYYTLFLDTNPLNEDFPKRSKSFIASNNYHKADGYARGPVMFCFPFNETKIALVNSDDMWDLRMDFDVLFSAGTSIADLNDFWEDLIGDMLLNTSHIKSLDDMIKAIRDEHPATVVDRLRREGFLHGIDRSKISDADIAKRFADSLPRAYSYRQLGCKLTTPDNIPDVHSDGSCEIWFSGKCVMVPENEMDDLKEEFGL